jgi:hypothetical protein
LWIIAACVGATPAVTVTQVENDLSQSLACARVQRAHEDLLGVVRLGAVAARGAPKAHAQAHATPVHRAVHRAAKSAADRRSLQQQRRAKRSSQSLGSRRWHSASTLEPRLGRCQCGKIRKRLLLAISLSRPYCSRASQPIYRSRAAHLSEEAEQLNTATHSPSYCAA